MLVLAAEDDLVPSKLVREMLQKMGHPCEVGCQPLEIASLKPMPASHAWLPVHRTLFIQDYLPGHIE